MNEEQLDKIHTYRRGDESNEGTRGSGESDLSWMKLAYRTFTQQPRVKAVDKPSTARWIRLYLSIPKQMLLQMRGIRAQVDSNSASAFSS